MLGVAVLISDRPKFLYLSGRKLQPDTRAKPNDLVLRQCRAADRFAVRIDLFKQPDRLEKIEGVWFVEKRLIEVFFQHFVCKLK